MLSLSLKKPDMFVELLPWKAAISYINWSILKEHFQATRLESELS